jgi:hypothetical protein
VGNDVDFSISYSSSKIKAILPWGKLYGIDGCLGFYLVYTFPLVLADLFPYFDLAIVPASSHYIFILGVCPSDLPAGTLMSKKF